MKKSLLATVMLSACLTQAHGQENLVNIQTLLDNFMKTDGAANGITGVSVTAQCPTYQSGASTPFTSGLQSTQGVPANAESMFEIGSASKGFASVVLLQLEAEGKLSITDTVGKYFSKEYPLWQNITIQQLMNMTSGIKDYLPLAAIKDYSNPYYVFKTDELLDMVKTDPLDFPSGSNWKYSNTNYALVGKIIEKITGKSLAEEIKNRIINVPTFEHPSSLNLKHTFYVTTFPKQNMPWYYVAHLMSGYVYPTRDGITPIPPYFTDGHDVIDYSISLANAAGSMISTPSDLSKFGRALFSKDAIELNRLLPEKQFKEFTSLVDIANGKPLPNGVSADHPSGYGLGLESNFDFNSNMQTYGHSGGIAGFETNWMYIPQTKASYAWTENADIDVKTINEDLDKQLKIFLYQNCF